LLTTEFDPISWLRRESRDAGRGLATDCKTHYSHFIGFTASGKVTSKITPGFAPEQVGIPALGGPEGSGRSAAPHAKWRLANLEWKKWKKRRKRTRAHRAKKITPK